MKSLLGQEFETMAKTRDSIKETLDHNRKSYRNGRKEPEVVVISSSEASEEEASEEEASEEDEDELA
jgi:hypothetical protein